jgi:hypothetical protein
MEKGHLEQVAKLHHEYQRYRLRQRRANGEPLEYAEWLEHTAIRLADAVGEMAEHVETLTDERDRYRHAADANNDCWVESMRINHSLYGVLAAVRFAAMRGDFSEVARLLIHWACWN